MLVADVGFNSITIAFITAYVSGSVMAWTLESTYIVVLLVQRQLELLVAMLDLCKENAVRIAPWRSRPELADARAEALLSCMVRRNLTCESGQ